MSNETDWAWVAGFFEGEGSFCIQRSWKKKPGRFVGWVEISQKHPEPLLFIQEILEDCTILHEETRVCNGVRFGTHTLVIHTIKATRFLKRVLPFMHHPEKIAKAKIFVRIFTEEGHSGIRLTEKRIEERENAWKEWLELKAEIRGDL